MNFPICPDRLTDIDELVRLGICVIPIAESVFIDLNISIIAAGTIIAGLALITRGKNLALRAWLICLVASLLIRPAFWISGALINRLFSNLTINLVMVAILVTTTAISNLRRPRGFQVAASVIASLQIIAAIIDPWIFRQITLKQSLSSWVPVIGEFLQFAVTIIHLREISRALIRDNSDQTDREIQVKAMLYLMMTEFFRLIAAIGAIAVIISPLTNWLFIRIFWLGAIIQLGASYWYLL